MAVAKPLRLLLLALALPAAPSAAGSYLLPDRAPAGREFTLYLRLSEICMSCAYAFSHETVAVEGSRIDLRYAVSLPKASIPPPAEAGPIRITAGTAPAFRMPALKAGRYEVWAAQVPACLLGQPSCAMPEPAPVQVGVLEADTGNPADWILNPSSGPGGQAFDLQLLGPGYSCATAFDSLSVAAAGDSVTLTFFDWERPMGCAQAYLLFGPTFRIPALPAGIYRVKVNRLSKHGVTDGGTLVVAQPLSLPLPEWRRRAARPAWNGDRFSFVLPEGGAGTWRAEWLDLQGRLRFAARFQGVPGKTVSVAIGGRAAGLGLLRLTAPAGGSHTLPVEAPVRSGNPGASHE